MSPNPLEWLSDLFPAFLSPAINVAEDVLQIALYPFYILLIIFGPLFGLVT